MIAALIFTLCQPIGCTPVSTETLRCLEQHHVDFEIVDNDPQGTDQRTVQHWLNRRVLAAWPKECRIGATT